MKASASVEIEKTVARERRIEATVLPARFGKQESWGPWVMRQAGDSNAAPSPGKPVLRAGDIGTESIFFSFVTALESGFNLFAEKSYQAQGDWRKLPIPLLERMNEHN
jgi:hypothetical protein